MADYSQMTQEEFDTILEEICGCDLTIGGVYEAVCENCGRPCDYDSEMCLCEECNPEKAYPDEEA